MPWRCFTVFHDNWKWFTYLSNSPTTFFLVVFSSASDSDALLFIEAPRVSGRLFCLTCFRVCGWKLGVVVVFKFCWAGVGTDSTENCELFCSRFAKPALAFISLNKPDPLLVGCWKDWETQLLNASVYLELCTFFSFFRPVFLLFG